MSSKRKYRSGFEEGCGEILEQAEFEYEPFKIPYFTKANYTPDFVYSIKDIYQCLVECKGWFRPGDQKKYLAIRDSLEDHQELVFLLQSPNKRVRKGALLTMALWCDKNDIRWFKTAEEVIDYVTKS